VARLRRSDLAAPGFRRRGRGRGFEYLDTEGRRIENEVTLERLRELLAYKNGRWRDVRAQDINDYIRETTKGDFTGKDFRTWHATVLAAVALAVAEPACRSRTARKRATRRAAEEVAHYLGNTPAVARSSYIDPRVFDRFEAGDTIRDALLGTTLEDMDGLATHGRIERAVVKLLED
jgi:DNA topoisomerase IB